MKRTTETILPFALIAAVIVITAVCAIHSRSASSEESASTTYGVPDSSYDPGPYGMSLEEIKKAQEKMDPWGLNRTEPLVRLKDLPPLPPPFGTGKRVKADGTVQMSGSIQDLPPELQQKIAALKARRLPCQQVQKEGEIYEN